MADEGSGIEYVAANEDEKNCGEVRRSGQIMHATAPFEARAGSVY